ncbi:MAG: sigma-70 family RNA polymerase sigma factor [Planctomycetes bacterium]|nr:sigma-70 family RNA polymerase sigma factor [Planctomycetota bacterium]
MRVSVDSRTFIQILVKDQHRLLAYVQAIVTDDHLSEDVVQEVFALAFERMTTFNDANHLLAWLRETARRKSLEMIRKSRRQPRVFDEKLLDLLEGHWRMVEPAEANVMLEALRRCLSELAPFARELIDVRYGKGLTGQALAEALGRKFNTVYSTLTRTHLALAECIRAQLSGDSTDAGGSLHDS